MKNLPNKSSARGLVGYHKRAGDIKMLPCEVCRYGITQAHHTDYSKPLEVMWLCRTHHQKWHEENETPIGGGYYYLNFEEKVAQEFKKKKPIGMTNTEYLASLLKSS